MENSRLYRYLNLTCSRFEVRDCLSWPTILFLPKHVRALCAPLLTLHLIECDADVIDASKDATFLDDPTREPCECQYAWEALLLRARHRVHTARTRIRSEAESGTGRIALEPKRQIVAPPIIPPWIKKQIPVTRRTRTDPLSTQAVAKRTKAATLLLSILLAFHI